MTTYRVYLSRTWSETGYICVDAESEDEARELVLNKEYDDENVKWGELENNWDETIEFVD